MKHLLQFMKAYRKEAVLAPLFKLLEAVFELFVPLVVANIIDKGIPQADRTVIWQSGGLLLVLAIIGLVVAISAQYFAAKAAVGVSTKLRQSVFTHILELDFGNVDTIGGSTLITRMTSDINQVQSGINMTLRLFLRSPIVVFGAMVMAFTIDVKSAFVFVVTIPLLAVIVYGIMFITMPKYKKVQRSLDDVLGLTRENLNGVRVIRAFNRQQEEIADFDAKNNFLQKSQMAVGRISALTNPATYVVVNAAIIVLIYNGAIQVNLGNLSQGQVVAIINYMNQILVELVKLANLIVTMTKAMACMQRVSDVLDIENPEEIAPEYQKELDTDAYLVFDRVGLTYRQAGEATLEDISFTVRKGETIGIIGGTGSGKSSLVQMIPGFYKASAGNIYLEGRNLGEYSPKELREKIGVVPQKAVLFQGTIRSNLCWGKEDATDEELWEAIDFAQAREVVEGKEGMLDAPIAAGGKNLSGGQRQRLTIARAFVRKPEILILDDSASALDYATDAKLRQAIRGLDKNVTTFLVSQRASSIMHADCILVMDDGKLVGKGTHEELLANCEVYQEIYYSQYPDEKGGAQ